MKSRPQGVRSSDPVVRSAAPGVLAGVGTVAHPAELLSPQQVTATPGLARTTVEVPRTGANRRVANKRRALRIGYVLDRFPRATHSFVLRELLQLQARGIELDVFSLGLPDGRIDDTAFALARLDNPVRYFPADGGRRDNGAKPPAPTPDEDVTAVDSAASEAPEKAITSRQAHWLSDQILARRIEHLHAHAATVPTEVAREAARAAGVGYSFTAYAHGLYEGANLPSLREKVADARFVVTLSDFDRGRLLRICGAEVANKLHRIPIGIDPEECRFSEPASHDSNSVLAVGPLVARSGFSDLIEAFALLRDRGRVAHLTIVGQGELRGELQAQIERCRLLNRVQLVTAASRGELAMLMRMHTAMALPWVADDGDRDVLSNVVLEAMAAGMLVLSTDLPGIRELIDDGITGRVISPRDPVWLAGALDTLFDCPELRERMAWRARTKVEKRFTAERNASHLARLFWHVTRQRLAT